MEKAQDNKIYHMDKTQSISLLIVLTLLYILCFADRQIFSIALEPMKIALGLSDTELGIIQAIFNVGLGILAIPGSILVDRWSRRKTIGIMAILWSIATFSTGLCRSFVQLIIPRAAVGIGEAGYFPGGSGWLSVVFSKDSRSRVLNVFGIGPVIGIVVGSVVGGMIIAKTNDWASPFWIFAIPGVILGVVVFFFKDYATVKDKGESGTVKSYLADWFGLFKIKAFRIIIIGQVFWALFYFTFLGWFAVLLMRGYGLDVGQAGLIVAGTALFGAITTPFGGWITDIWHKRNKTGRAYMMVVVQGLCVVFLLLAIFLYGISLPVYICIIALSAVATSMITGTVSTMISDVVPVKHRASGVAWNVVFNYLFGASLGSWLVGAVSDAFGGGSDGLRMAFICIAPALIIAFVIHFLNIRGSYVEDSARCTDQVFDERSA